MWKKFNNINEINNTKRNFFIIAKGYYSITGTKHPYLPTLVTIATLEDGSRVLYDQYKDEVIDITKYENVEIYWSDVYLPYNPIDPSLEIYDYKM